MQLDLCFCLNSSSSDLDLFEDKYLRREADVGFMQEIVL